MTQQLKDNDFKAVVFIITMFIIMIYFYKEHYKHKIESTIDKNNIQLLQNTIIEMDSIQQESFKLYEKVKR